MHFAKRLITFLSIPFYVVSAMALTVEGTILDENKEPVIGATVSLEGSKGIATITNIDGIFSLDVPNIKEDKLLISYVGYRTQCVPVNGRTVLNIDLVPEPSQLNEVVVVGYGNMNKNDLTGSLTSVATTDIEAAAATSFDRMLQGKAAGVTVSTGSAAPGGSVSVRIRGNSSLRGNNSPLYVLDGNVISGMGDTDNPMSSGTGGGNSRAEEQNPLTAINPQDIESIEILKDASATAIYGSQGANGVILITTKQGKAAQPVVTISANMTISRLYKEIPMLSTLDYLDFRNSEVFNGSGSTPLTIDDITPVNWQRASTRTAFSQNYRASVSGKSNKTTYFLALGYADQQGIINKTGVDKFDIRVNLGQEINDRMNIRLNTAYANISTSMTSGTDKLANTRTSIVRHMISFKPYRSSIAEGYDTYDEYITTPEAWFTDYDDDSREHQFNANLTYDYKVLKWLTLQAKGGVVYKSKSRAMWFGTMTSVGAQANGKAGLAEMSGEVYNGQILAQVKHKFNRKNSINGTFGIEYTHKDLCQNSITGEDFFSSELRADGISLARTLYPYIFNKVGEQLFSAFGRALYNYDNRYLATVTFRADGSSKFDADNRFSYFPSVALAWRINQEKWLQDVEVLSNLKLRLGWGQVGNQAISAYQTQSTYSNIYAAKPDGSSETGIIPSRISNPNLKWETSEQFNIGVDAGFFSQRLSATVDAYVKNTRDLLQQIAIPTSSGFSTMWINNGRIQNKGIELTIDATPYTDREWTLNIGGNISFQKNTIKELGIPSTDFGMLHDVVGYWGENVGNGTYNKFPANAFIVGQSIGLFMGYQTDGIMQESLYYSPEYQKNPLTINGSKIQPGDILYVDQNGDSVIDDRDRVILGNPNPKFVYAINASATYKNITLSMVFNGVYGNRILNANLIDETDVKNANMNVRSDSFFQAWTTENGSNTYPRLGYQHQGVLCDRYIEDGSYFKMSQLSLSWLLNFKRSKTIKSLNLSFTANNLFIITSYSGYDPDVNTFSNDVDRMGIDLTSYPSARNYTFGVIATF